jgi:hypothetical protein
LRPEVVHDEQEVAAENRSHKLRRSFHRFCRSAALGAMCVHARVTLGGRAPQSGTGCFRRGSRRGRRSYN